MVDYYETLEVSRNATQDDIKKSYRVLAKKFHPDVNTGDKKAEIRFKEIGEAYGVLSDDTKKAEYDNRRLKEQTSQSNTNMRSQNRETTNGAEFFNHNNSVNNFEDFFGFNPKGSSFKGGEDSKVKPMKTQDAFDAIFGKNRF